MSIKIIIIDIYNYEVCSSKYSIILLDILDKFSQIPLLVLMHPKFQLEASQIKNH